MRRTIIRLLSVLLCAAMLCGMLPAAFATENEPEAKVTTEETVAPAEETTEEAAEAPADTVEEMVPETAAAEAEQLLDAGETDNTITQAQFLDELAAAEGSYDLDKELTLEDDLTISVEYFLFVSEGGVIVVPEGKTLTIQSNVAVSSGAVTVEAGGALVIEGNGWLQINGGTLTVETGGSFTADAGKLWVYPSGAQVSGVEKSLIHAVFLPATFAELKAALTVTDPYDMIEVTPSSSITLEEELTVPDTVLLNVLNMGNGIVLTIPAGVTVTNEGRIVLRADTELRIEEGGALINNGNLDTSSGVFTCDGTFTNNGTWNESGGETNVVKAFSNFDELKKYAAQTYPEFTDVYYVGENPLVITEDLTIPQSLHIDIAGVQVPEGVTLTVSGTLSVATLLVDGSVRVEYGNVYVNNALTINETTGSLYYNGYIELLGDATLTGADQIDYAQTWYSLYRKYAVTNTEGFVAVLGKAAGSSESNMLYALELDQADITLTGEISIPQNCVLYLYSDSTLTVAKGCTVAWNPMDTRIVGTLNLQGELCNNTSLTVYHDQGGKLVLGETGEYSGTGILRVCSSQATGKADLSGALVGFDLSQYEATQASYDQAFWELKFVEGLIQLGMPTDLEWGLDANGTEIPGCVRWKTASPDQGRVTICLYRVGEDEDTCITQEGWFFSVSSEPVYRSISSFLKLDLESGIYYFTVTSVGDNVTYCNSETAKSENWVYVRPEQQVGPCGDISWNWPKTSYSTPEDMTGVNGYEMELYFSTSEDTVLSWPVSTSMIFSGGGKVNFSVEDYDLQRCGAGYYYFRVRALSSDITKYRNGEWSELSPAYNLTQAAMDLDTIINNDNLDTNAKVEAVQDMDAEDLKTAMLADSKVVDKLAALETEVSSTSTSVTVAEEIGINADKVTVVGAKLNSTSENAGTDDITLVISAPEQDDVIPALYDDTVAVSFSMDLENVENTKSLKVPVQITLPVPDNINPNFLVILHYHTEGGEPEEIRPYVYLDGTQWYASFVLTSFSDFVLTMKAVRGDFTGDRNVTIEDAAELLWRAMFDAPASARADFNGDEEVNSDDVVYLLWHILFPNLFPLE